VCVVLAEGVFFFFFLAVARVVWRNRRVDGCQSRWSSIFYRRFLGGRLSVDYGGVGPLPVNIWERAVSPCSTLLHTTLFLLRIDTYC